MSPQSALFAPRVYPRPINAPRPLAVDLVSRLAYRPANLQALLAEALDRLDWRGRQRFVARYNHAAGEMLQALDFLRQHPLRDAAWNEAPFGLAPRQVAGAAATLIGAGLEGLGLLERHDEATLQGLAVAKWRSLVAVPSGAPQLPVHLAPLVRVYAALAANTHELVPGVSRATMRYLNAALLQGGAPGLRRAAEALTTKHELKLHLRTLARRPAATATATAKATAKAKATASAPTPATASAPIPATLPASTQATAPVSPRAPAKGTYMGRGTYGGYVASLGGRPPLVAPPAAVSHATPASVAAPAPAPVQTQRSASPQDEQKPNLTLRKVERFPTTDLATVPSATADASGAACGSAPASKKRRASLRDEGEVDAKRLRQASVPNSPPSLWASSADSQLFPSPASLSDPTSRGETPVSLFEQIRSLLDQAPAAAATPVAPAAAAVVTAQVGIDGLGTLEVPAPWIGAMLRQQPPSTAANATDWRTVGFAGLKLDMTLAGLHALVHDGAPEAVTAVRSYPGDVTLPVRALRQLIALPAGAQLGQDPIRVVVGGLGATLPLSQVPTLLGLDVDAAA